MPNDLSVISAWWAVVYVCGLVGWPMAAVLFPKWTNRGYLLAKAVGLIATTFVVWILGSIKVVPFGVPSIVAAMAIVLAAGVMAKRALVKEKLSINWRLLVAEELFFLTALFFWSWIKAHEPSINGLEKFMDYGFTKSIMRSQFFPPTDMWFSGQPINYYYFGHLMLATIGKISGVALEYGFNLILATLFGLCLTMSFAIGRELLAKFSPGHRLAGAMLIAFLVTSSGNLHTIYLLTKGYWGEENPPPFWQIWSQVGNKEKLVEGLNNYWYPNATRFIPYTIHEFPAYSFVVSDIHGHVLSIPIVLLMLAMLVQIFKDRGGEISYWEAGAYGLVAGTAFMTNALDGPIYLALFGLLVVMEKIKYNLLNIGVVFKHKNIKKVATIFAVTGTVFVFSVLPFVMNFKPFVNGVAVNCPPQKMADTKIGPLIFEGVEKCQKSPLWMMLILWGFFLYNGLGLWLLTREKTEHKRMFLVWSGVAFLLIEFAEFFYFKDIYPQHFRSNTMFKLGYQAFIIMSIVSGYTIVKLAAEKKKTIWVKGFLICLTPLLILVSVYPYFAVRSYFGGLKEYRGLWGLQWMADKYPDDLAAVNWLNVNVAGQPVVLEAAGDSYTDYERVSAFTGLPTVAGWAVHEWLWRGSYDPIAKRAVEVANVYESPDLELTKAVLKKYQVSYIVIGELERTKYLNLNEEKISMLGTVVFSSAATKIYRVVN